MFDNEMDFENRIAAPEYTPADGEIELSLRPRTLGEYIGQEKVKENMRVFIQAAKGRGEPLDHVLSTALRDWARPPSRGSSPTR